MFLQIFIHLMSSQDVVLSFNSLAKIQRCFWFKNFSMSFKFIDQIDKKCDKASQKLLIGMWKLYNERFKINISVSKVSVYLFSGLFHSSKSVFIYLFMSDKLNIFFFPFKATLRWQLKRSSSRNSITIISSATIQKFFPAIKWSFKRKNIMCLLWSMHHTATLQVMSVEVEFLSLAARKFPNNWARLWASCTWRYLVKIYKEESDERFNFWYRVSCIGIWNWRIF